MTAATAATATRQRTPIPEVITVKEAIERTAERLDAVSRELHEGYLEIDSAEDKWERCYDEVGEDLAEEFRERGTKRDPSEHAIITEARRRYRVEWHAYRRAKRKIEKAEKISQNRRAQLTAYQTLFKNFGAEAEVQDYLGQA